MRPPRDVGRSAAHRRERERSPPYLLEKPEAEKVEGRNPNERDEEEDPQWDDYQVYLEEKQETVKLEGKDYIALFVASLQTIFLPLIIMIIVFFAIGIFLFLII